MYKTGCQVLLSAFWRNIPFYLQARNALRRATALSGGIRGFLKLKGLGLAPTNLRGALLVAGLFLARGLFLLAGEGSLGGDGMGYVYAAQSLLTTGNLPPAPNQQLGLAIMLTPILALLGEPGLIEYTTLPYPGFPGFVGVPVANAIFVVQVAMDLTIVLILFLEARRFLANAPRALAFSVYGFLILQPFTAQLTSHILPDGPAMFFTFIGAWLLWRSYANGNSIIGLCAGALGLGLAVLARLDMLPVVASLVCVIAALAWRTRGIAVALRVAALCLPLLLVPCGGMLALQYKSTGQVAAEAALRGQSPEAGYFAWARSWILLYPRDTVQFGMHAAGAAQSAGWKIDGFPSYAFGSTAAKAEASKILSDWQRSGYDSGIDARLGKIASENRHARPLFTYVILPTARIAQHWINYEGARPIKVSLHLDERRGRIAVLMIAPLRILFVLLGLAGAGVVWVDQRGGNLSWDDGYGLVRLLSLLALLRTVELGALGTIMWSGLMEPRYVLPALPGMLLLAVIGARKVYTSISERRSARMVACAERAPA